VHKRGRQTTDNRQRDHATEKCVEIGGVARAAKAIPPNNYWRRHIMQPS